MPGAERPNDYGDPAAEYSAAVDGAAVLDVSDRTLVELTGRDRAKFLHNFCTNDIKRLSPGQGCEAFLVNVKGRVLFHGFVFAGPESLWIETVPGAAAALVPHLDRYLITEDVQLHDRTPEWGELLVSGRQAAGRLATLLPGADALPPYGQTAAEWNGLMIWVRRVDLLGAPGFLLATRRERMADLWQALVEAGCRPAGTAAFHARRIEAGMPLYGVDITDDQLAQEVGRTAQAISFTKGCYLGQEPIARIDALGHVNRELRGLRLEQGPPPAAGAAVLADGKEIGTITSSAPIPGDDTAVALAYLRRPFTNPGTAVTVRGDSETVPAVVFWPAS